LILRTRVWNLFGYGLVEKIVLDKSLLLNVNKYRLFMNPKDIIHRSAFGVCSYIGRKIGIASSKVRIYFIYLSFLTLGSPVIIYLFFAFWLDVKRLFKPVRSLLND